MIRSVKRSDIRVEQIEGPNGVEFKAVLLISATAHSGMLPGSMNAAMIADFENGLRDEVRYLARQLLATLASYTLTAGESVARIPAPFLSEAVEPLLNVGIRNDDADRATAGSTEAAKV